MLLQVGTAEGGIEVDGQLGKDVSNKVGSNAGFLDGIDELSKFGIKVGKVDGTKVCNGVGIVLKIVLGVTDDFAEDSK